MEMKSARFDRERGQILVQVALMVVVLFAFVGLALDVGHVYGGRRRMQNAADAGALAGARIICLGESEVDAKQAAIDYAENRNGAQTVDVEFWEGNTVIVDAAATLDTFFAGLIGIDTAEVRAQAAAACGPASNLCNLWPIGFSAEQYETLTDTVGCDAHILLWTDGRANCDTYTCTCNPPYADPVSATLDGRVWLDFSAVLTETQLDPCDSSGGGASELKYRIIGENNKGEKCLSYAPPEGCVAGSTGSGVASSVWDEVGVQIEEADDDVYRYIPLYDPVRSSPSGIPCTVEGAGTNIGNERFYLERPVCLEILAICNLCEKDEEDLSKCNSGPKVIEARIPCGNQCYDSCAATSGGSPGPGDVLGVSLVPVPNR